MPNGGMDNCSTCCFNEANDGQVARHNPDGIQRCLIRDIVVKDPYHSYCANHPCHNLDRIELPIGPVTHGPLRKVLVESPDSPEIRAELLKILAAISEIPKSDWPTTNLEEDAIQQLGVFRESEAREGLHRVCLFDPFASPSGELPKNSGRTRRNRIWTVTVAIEALARIAGDEVLPILKHYLTPPESSSNTPHGQWPAEIRFRCVMALAECSQEESMQLFELAAKDIDPTIAEHAEKLRAGRLAE